jgi:hypothetical protein
MFLKNEEAGSAVVSKYIDNRYCDFWTAIPENHCAWQNSQSLSMEILFYIDYLNGYTDQPLSYQKVSRGSAGACFADGIH